MRALALAGFLIVQAPGLGEFAEKRTEIFVIHNRIPFLIGSYGVNMMSFLPVLNVLQNRTFLSDCQAPCAAPMNARIRAGSLTARGRLNIPAKWCCVALCARLCS
jgi:hypothetical protein